MVKPKSKLFILLAFFMALMVVASNFLVQFPIKYLELQSILTYGAFSYPVTFLITDLANRRYGKNEARKIDYIGLFLGIFLTFFLLVMVHFFLIYLVYVK